MTDVEKYLQLAKKVFNFGAEKVMDSTKDLATKLQIERKRLEIKSQIGQHQRQMSKAYERIGEAYYKHLETAQPVEGINDVLEIVRSNKKVVELLKEQLAEIDGQ
ncbi:MAG: hypothetical protein IKE51_01705 [Solobacterium sp.]|nr:hypothetical protein [Solobacterium sp.]